MHQQRIADLVIGDGEMAVPEQRQLFQERATGLHHAVQPPGLDVFDVLEVEQAALQASQQSVEVFFDALGMQQLLERPPQTEVKEMAETRWPAREAAPPQQQGNA